MHPHCIHGSVSALGLSFRNDSKDKRVGLGGTLACGPIQALVTQRDTAGFRPVQPGSMRSATVPAMLSPAGTHQGHFSRDLIGICFGLLRAGKFDFIRFKRIQRRNGFNGETRDLNLKFDGE